MKLIKTKKKKCQNENPSTKMCKENDVTNKRPYSDDMLKMCTAILHFRFVFSMFDLPADYMCVCLACVQATASSHYCFIHSPYFHTICYHLRLRSQAHHWLNQHRFLMTIFLLSAISEHLPSERTSCCATMTWYYECICAQCQCFNGYSPFQQCS